jgi:hypothetical protein
MKYIQTFKDKINDWEKAKYEEHRLTQELRKDVKELIILIVSILDEMTPDNTRESFNINVDSNNNNNYFKITNSKANLNNDRDINLHLNGISTLIYWKDSMSKIQNNSLWNFNAGGIENYIEIADILEGLIKKYNKAYEAVLIKKDSNKYNL